MADFLTFVVAGLAGGSSYALLALGLVLVAKSSRLLNFAQGEIGALATFVVASLAVSHGWPWPAAIAVGLVVAAALGTVTAVVLLGRSGGRIPPLVGTVALLSLLVVVESRYLGGPRVFPTPLTGEGLKLAGVVLTPTRLLVIGSVTVTCLALWLLVERTPAGLALRAGADDREAATVVGLSPRSTEAVAWLVASLLGALAGVFLGWTNQSIAPGFLTLALTRAFAAAILAGMASLPGAVVGGLVVGVAESLTRRYWGATPGSPDFVVFALLFVLLLFRPQGVFARGARFVRVEGEESLVSLRNLVSIPRRAGRAGAARALTGVVAAAVAAGWLIPERQAFRAAAVPVFCILALSLNSLLASTGQLSLGHVGLFGFGAFMTGVAATTWTFSFVPAVLVGTVSAGLASFALGVAALRVRGLYLAVLTLAFGAVLEAFVFPRPVFSQGGAGLFVSRPALGPFDLADDRTFLVLCFVVFGLVVLADRRLLASPLGRAFVAVRENEAAAAARGISPPGVKIAAFVFSGLLAGVAGALFAYRQTIIVATSFPAALSFSLLVYVVLGGIASRVGVVAVTALFVWTGEAGGGGGNDLLLIAGSAAVVLLIGRYPDGIGGALRRLVDRRRSGPTLVPAVPRHSAPPPSKPAPPRTTVRLPDGRRVRPALLAARDVSVRFGALAALDGVSLVVEPGRIVGVIGPNGAGKTTLFNCLSGYLRPDAGRVWLAGTAVEDAGVAARASRGLGRTFQQGGLCRSETALGNLLVAQHLGVARGPVRGLLALGPGEQVRERQRRAVAESVLDILGLHAMADVPVAALPYGTRKLLEIGCALVTRPRVLLLDEPAAGMSADEIAWFGGVVRALRTDLGLAVVVIEHHVPLVRRVADEVTVLNFGGVIARGTPEEVVRDPLVVEAYLGAHASGPTDRVGPSMRRHASPPGTKAGAQGLGQERERGT